MSDFLGRLMDRHAETSASPIVPRGISRFETPSLTSEREAVEPSVPVEAKSLAPREVETRLPSSHVKTSSAKEPASNRVVRDVRTEGNPAVRADPPNIRVEQILKQVETLVSDRHAAIEPSHDARREEPIVASPVVPRAVASPEHRDAPDAVPGSLRSTTAETEQTVIRVHIGRIEVRAAAPPVERPRPRVAKPEPPKPMSLERYLSGKERA